MRKFAALLCAAVIAVSFLAGCGVDPNVKQEATKSDGYQVETKSSVDEADGSAGFTAYASGKTDPVDLNGVEVDVNAFALRSYELGFMIGEAEFDKPEDMSVDAATQYAVTHIFYDDFYRIDNRAVSLRTVGVSQAEEVLKQQFGRVTHDPSKSMLYNPSSKKLEMWMPQYGTNLYYNIDAAQVDGDELTIDTTFFREKEKSTLLCHTTITVGIEDGKPVIKSLSAKAE